MSITVLLTSYNRPVLLRRALDSLQAQTVEDWRCCVIDDDSPQEVKDIIHEYADADPRIEPWAVVGVTPEARAASARYSVNINRFYHLVNDPLALVHMCDNVEYMPGCFAAVMDHFTAHPDALAGYVLHKRDIWQDGRVVGLLSLRGHGDTTPPHPGHVVRNPLGRLDHSQVFFRGHVRLQWPEELRYRDRGDGVAFTRFVERHGGIPPIAPYDAVLSVEHYDRI